MKYKGFWMKITPVKNLSREDKNGEIVACEGFTIEVFSDESEKVEIDVFTVAVDFELLKKQHRRSRTVCQGYIDAEEKEYQRMLDEFNINK